MVEITFDTRQARLRFAGFIQACQNNLKHALGDVAVTLGHGQHRTLQEVEQFVIAEGRNRQIRRTFRALGYTVVKLHRTHFGNVTLGSLKPGQWKKLDKVI